MYNINSLHFSNIGYCIADPVHKILKFFSKNNFKNDNIRFIFLEFNSFFVPFKIIEVLNKKNIMCFKIEDFDVLNDYFYKKMNIYIEQDEYNERVIELIDFDVNGFNVICEDGVIYGSICDVYDYPNNKCICVKGDCFEKIIPFNKYFIKSVDVNKKEVVLLKAVLQL